MVNFDRQQSAQFLHVNAPYLINQTPRPTVERLSNSYTLQSWLSQWLRLAGIVFWLLSYAAIVGFVIFVLLAIGHSDTSLFLTIFVIAPTLIVISVGSIIW